MHDSLTWQFLPPWLQDPLLAGVVTQAEAAELWDLVLRSDGQRMRLPAHLLPAANRVFLFNVQVGPTRH